MKSPSIGTARWFIYWLHFNEVSIRYIHMEAFYKNSARAEMPGTVFNNLENYAYPRLSLVAVVVVIHQVHALHRIHQGEHGAALSLAGC